MKITKTLLGIIAGIILAACGGGGGSSSTTGVASPPLTVTKASDDSVSVTLNMAMNINVLANDSVADGGTLSITSITQGSNGSVATNSDNTITYMPNGGFTGSDSFTYTISDGIGGAGTATVNIDVKPPGVGPYLGYVVGSNIYTVDKNNPGSTRLIATDLLDGSGLNHVGNSTVLVRRHTIDATKTSASIGDPELLVYAGATKFWKVDMSVGSNLMPAPLMSTTYSKLCRFELDGDSYTLEDSLLFYELPGPDNDCAVATDNTRWMMRVAKSTVYPAVEITTATNDLGSVITVRDVVASNVVLGFIAIKGADIIHYDASFSSPKTVSTSANVIDINFGGTRLDLIDFDKSGGFLQIDNVVYWYDFQAKTLSSALHVMAERTGSSDMSCDDTECFFSNLVTTSTSSINENVYRIPKDGTGIATLLTMVIGGFGSSYYDAITSNYLYVANGDTNELISIARSDGTIVTIDTNVDQFIGGNNSLYYDRGDTAVILDNDGNPVSEFMNASWVGLNYLSFGISGNTNVTLERIILAQKAVGQADYSGATLQSYNPNTNLKDVDLGMMPVGTTPVFAYALGGGGMLGMLQINGSAGSDITWMNPTVAGSLVRLTNDTQDKYSLE